MAGSWKLRRIGISTLCLSLWAFLMPLDNPQSIHELRELAIHGSAADASSERIVAAAQRAHDCHSCLVSHPKTFAGLTLARSVDSMSQAGTARRLAGLDPVPRIERHSPRKRSPPA